jgi:hypothetical protein
VGHVAAADAERTIFLRNPVCRRIPPDAIQLALDKYAEKSAADLELLSIIVYAEREASQARRRMAFEELGRKVKQIKPWFSEATILRNINELMRDGMLVVGSTHE